MLQGRPIFFAGLRGKCGEEVADLVVDLGRIVDRGRDLLAESLAVAAAEAVDGDPHGPLGRAQPGGERRIGDGAGPSVNTGLSASNVVD